MAILSIDVPDTKIPHIVEAVRLYKTDPSMTSPEVVTFLEERFTSELRRIVKWYQRGLYDAGFDFDDPMTP